MHTKIYGLEMFRVVLFIIVKILERNEISNCVETMCEIYMKRLVGKEKTN